MTVSYLSPSHRARYAADAAFERDERARIYRARAAAEGRSEVAALAEADWQAWAAIALWCAGERIDWQIGLADETGPGAPRASNLALMAHAAALGLQQCEAAAAKRPADQAAARRRDRVAEILSMLQRNIAFIDDLNAALRRRARSAEAA